MAENITEKKYLDEAGLRQVVQWIKTNYQTLVTSENLGNFGTAALANVNTTGIKDDVTTNNTTLPTTVQVKSYVGTAVSTAVAGVTDGLGDAAAKDVAESISGEGDKDKLVTAEQVKDYVDTVVGDSIGGVTSVDFKKVDALPAAADATAGTIYLVLNGDNTEGNIYNEYIAIDGAWELIGTTAIDTDSIVEGYVKEEDLADAIAEAGILNDYVTSEAADAAYVKVVNFLTEAEINTILGVQTVTE